MKILLTSTSFQDTPGKHQELLAAQNYEIDTLRGPVKEAVLLPIIADYDGIVCGDDEITRQVIAKGKAGKLKIISKYGIGLDKIDLKAAAEIGMPVTNTPGVNHTTVAEHAMALLLTFYKNIHVEHNFTRKGEWKRLTGNEIMHKKMGIIGLGKIGKELAKRAAAFGLQLFAFDKFIDEKFVQEYNVTVCKSVEELVSKVEIISINVNLSAETKGLLSAQILEGNLNEGTVIVNTARALIIDQPALLKHLKTRKIAGYLTDVMDVEPMPSDHPLLQFDNVLITPHIGSRTYQSVERQGFAAIRNLIKGLK